MVLQLILLTVAAFLAGYATAGAVYVYKSNTPGDTLELEGTVIDTVKGKYTETAVINAGKGPRGVPSFYSFPMKAEIGDRVKIQVKKEAKE